MKWRIFGFVLSVTMFACGTVVADDQSLVAIIQNGSDKPIVKAKVTLSNSNGQSRTSRKKMLGEMRFQRIIRWEATPIHSKQRLT